MQRHFLLSLTAIVSLFIFTTSCNKLDTTDIGGSLIPPVDNVTTFDTTLTVNVTQGIFTDDSTTLLRTEDHVLGSINNDPIFGKTNSIVFLELKPSFFPFYLGAAKDTLSGIPGTGLDSVVLCLKYRGFYGDTSIPQKISVYAIDNSVIDFKDSVYKIGRYYPAINNTLLGSVFADPKTLNNGFKMNNQRDSVYGQVRIRLTNPAFINALFGRDTLTAGGNNAFRTDSLFRSFYKGFAVVADSAGGNGLFYVNLADTSTRLEVHFKRKAFNGTKIDSVFTRLAFNTSATSTNGASAYANYISRKRAGSEIASPAPNSVYIQTTPGTYASLSIPALNTLSNRIVHRAELIMEQVPDPLNYVMLPPNYLYVDVKDTSATVKYKPLPYDLSPNEAYTFYPGGAGIDFSYYGGYVRHKTDGFGNGIVFYNFNLSRYVQAIITRHEPNYQLRLSAPFNLSYSEFIFGAAAYANSIAYGRIKLGNGNNPNYRMRLHIIYSKI